MEQKYYAFPKGDSIINTIFDNWDSCIPIIKSAGRYKSFTDVDKAKNYLVECSGGKSIKITFAWSGEIVIVRGTKRIMTSRDKESTPTIKEDVPVAVKTVQEIQEIKVLNESLIEDIPPCMVEEPKPKEKKLSKIYAVKLGRKKTGEIVKDTIYYSWPECRTVTEGCPHKFKSFLTEEEAEEWMLLESYVPYGYSNNNNDILRELDFDTRLEFENRCFTMDMSMETIIASLINEWLITESDDEQKEEVLP